MSADLWEAFGGEDGSSNPWSQPSPREEKTISQPQPTVISQPVRQETLLNANPLQAFPTVQSPWDTDFAADLAAESKTTNALHGSSWTDSTTADAGWTDFVSPDRQPDSWSTARPSYTAEVLWDADEAVKEDDDFGDFENPAPEVSKLYLEPSKPQKPAPTPSTAVPTVLKAPLRKLNAPKEYRTAQASHDSTSSKISTSKILGLPTKEQLPDPDESWDEWSPDPKRRTEFSDKSQASGLPTRAAAIATTSSKSGQPSSTSKMHPTASLNRSQPAASLPPTNIPPPSILISLLSSLISTLPTQVEAAMESFTSKDTPNAVADKALSTAVRKCLAALRVAARIVAGRKVRWKRDTHLAQSMSIGPAGSGGRSGMKLAGLDRNEIKREDREVAEFVIVWQNRLGSVRKALTSVNSRIGDTSSSSNATTNKKLELPSISDAMLVRTVKEQDGGIKSAKACALCGVKREERVEKVDMDVFDGFGEWWFDHWGHVECRVFWYQHEKYLQQR